MASAYPQRICALRVLRTMVPVEGVEPTCPFGRSILSRLRLPFRHTGTGCSITSKHLARQQVTIKIHRTNCRPRQRPREALCGSLSRQGSLMPMSLPTALRPNGAAAAFIVAGGGAATILGAYYFP